jgi:hypothetical protein
MKPKQQLYKKAKMKAIRNKEFYNRLGGPNLNRLAEVDLTITDLQISAHTQ